MISPGRTEHHGDYSLPTIYGLCGSDCRLQATKHPLSDSRRLWVSRHRLSWLRDHDADVGQAGGRGRQTRELLRPTDMLPEPQSAAVRPISGNVFEGWFWKNYSTVCKYALRFCCVDYGDRSYDKFGNKNDNENNSVIYNVIIRIHVIIRMIM